MIGIHLHIDGMSCDFDLARDLAAVLARRDDEETMLISWNDRVRGIHSPQCLKCEIKGAPGWEVYGRNHGGRLRIDVNDDQFVFIHS